MARAYALLSADPAGAAEQAKTAVDLFASARDPLREAQARMLAGTALSKITLRATAEARAQFAEARALFDRCGAQLYVMKALREETRLSRTTGV
jgi:hypothetical protein